MLDKSINGALVALRKNIIRGNLEGLEHVEALLHLCGVDLKPVSKPNDTRFRHAVVKRLMLECLREGPKGNAQIADFMVAREPSITRTDAVRRSYHALRRLEASGVVVRSGKRSQRGRVWRLAR